MKCLKLACLIFIYSLLSVYNHLTFAQGVCGNEYFEQHVKLYPNYFSEYKSFSQQAPIHNQRAQSADLITIPVAVHVLHTGEAIGQGANLSDKQIIDAIQYANDLWRNANGNSLDMNFQFCLANKTPQGLPSNGIVRVDASHIANYKELGMSYGGVPGANEIVLKNLSNWNHDYVYNIWIVSKISKENIAAFAYYPLGVHFNYDGATVMYEYMSANSPTLAHELGHALGLYHTFEGSENSCPLNDNCSNQGDKVCDTPPHVKYDCELTQCSSSPDVYNSFLNIMSYCWQRILFTQGQKDRAYSQFYSTVRKNLMNSKACQIICDSIHTQDIQYACGNSKSDTVVNIYTAINGCDSMVTQITHYNPPLNLQMDVDSLSLTNQYIFHSDTNQLSGNFMKWYVNDTFMMRGASFIFDVKDGRYYVVKLKGENACGLDSIEYIIDRTKPTSVKNQYLAKAIHVYPNPTDGDFTIVLNGAIQGNYSMMIFDELGRVVAIKKMDVIEKQEISTKQFLLSSGVYQLIVLKDGFPLESIRLMLK
ncbi:MAG: zinc-dependent metalloprotease [Chitinophagales bacterium]|nr:zinc-dependent metalloprotease [Chitinophagales bacterium]